jgi:hypothetical protein
MYFRLCYSYIKHYCFNFFQIIFKPIIFTPQNNQILYDNVFEKFIDNSYIDNNYIDNNYIEDDYECDDKEICEINKDYIFIDR